MDARARIDVAELESQAPGPQAEQTVRVDARRGAAARAGERAGASAAERAGPISDDEGERSLRRWVIRASE
jgi:hypothetical protein